MICYTTRFKAKTHLRRMGTQLKALRLELF